MTKITPAEAIAIPEGSKLNGDNTRTPSLRIDAEAPEREAVVASTVELTDGSVLEHYA
jgi:hypothetical protein